MQEISRYEEPIGSNPVVRENRPRKKIASKTLGVVAPVVLTTILFLFAALTMTIATGWLSNLPFGNGTRQIVFNIFNGMLLSLPVLVSLWMVLGGQTWFIRIPLATFCLVAWLGIFISTLNFWGPPPPEIWLIFGGITLAVSIGTQIPLWIFGLRYGALITRANSGSVVQTQFTIKELLITTTVFAFLIPILQRVATFENFGNAPLYEICGFCAIFIVVLVFLMAFSVLVVFSKHRIKSLCILVLGIVALPFVVVPTIISVMEKRLAFGDFMEMGMDIFLFLDMGLNVFAFSLSNAVAVIAVLSMYYALGFRLRTQQV